MGWNTEPLNTMANSFIFIIAGCNQGRIPSSQHDTVRLLQRPPGDAPCPSRVHGIDMSEVDGLEHRTTEYNGEFIYFYDCGRAATKAEFLAANPMMYGCYSAPQVMPHAQPGSRDR